MSHARSTCVVLALLILSPVRATWAQAADPPDATADQAAIRVGIFDSRALAVAYYRSAAFRDRLGELRQRLERAKADGNKAVVEQLSKQGPALQAMAHKQTFSTWPVDDLLEMIKDDLPQIARRAGVDMIVSKWQVAWMKKGTPVVDITQQVVQPFHPDEATAKIIKDVRNQAPVPVESLKNHEH